MSLLLAGVSAHEGELYLLFPTSGPRICQGEQTILWQNVCQFGDDATCWGMPVVAPCHWHVLLKAAISYGPYVFRGHMTYHKTLVTWSHWLHSLFDLLYLDLLAGVLGDPDVHNVYRCGACWAGIRLTFEAFPLLQRHCLHSWSVLCTLICSPCCTLIPLYGTYIVLQHGICKSHGFSYTELTWSWSWLTDS